ncbi:proton-coupled folate transporter-like isoform X4 [Aquarana catesbeiana]|uniref:proton-coupled folate transporter-like isoform X4 n=1 Tax=Aquarana catesbeiana TaxID=8400 RepID=UPI003CC9D20F
MCRSLQSILTVEPVLFLFMTGIFLQTPAYQQMILYKVCQELYNDTECGEIQKNKDKYEVVQSRGSYIMLIYIAIMSLMSVLPALILGTWSDKGSRRHGMILPSIFSVASGGLFIAISYFKEISVYWTFAAAALIGISGGHVSMFLSVFSYLADITENSQRTFRMGIAESMIFIGGTSGFLLGGSLLQHSTFTIVFGVYCGCNLLAALYILFWLQESKSHSGYSKLYEEYHGDDDDHCETSEGQKDHPKRSVIKYVKDSFRTICKKREGHNRLKFFIVLISVFLINICNVGEQSITLMFVSYSPRSFNNELYGWYTASKMLISGLCLLFTLHWLLKHVEETKLAKVGVIMRTISFLLLAFSTTKWMIFLREKRLGGHHSSEDTTDPPPHEEVEIPQSQQKEEEGDVIKIVTTTGDRDVVDQGHISSESAQILIGEIMGCNRDLKNIKQNINDVQNKMKNIIEVLGRV